MCVYKSNYYLNNLMDIYEYMELSLEMILDEIIQQYNLRNLSHKVFVYMAIQNSMYGLPKAGKIANDKLNLNLAKFG